VTIKLPIGKLDRQITIQSLAQGIGEEYGEPTQTWSDWLTVWANVYTSGREFEAARQVNGEISAQIQIRHLAGLSDTMRILYDGKYFDIDHFNEVGRRERINIFAKARQV
jgi:SPP1 family predicted phage head-tail adaptor